jgi:hypothetical protein
MDARREKIINIGHKHGLNERQVNMLRMMAEYDFKKYNYHCPFERADAFDWRTINALLHRGLLEIVGRHDSNLREGVAMTDLGRAIINEIKGR